MRIGQNSVGAADVVVNHLRLSSPTSVARAFSSCSMIWRQHLVQPLDDVGFGFAQSHLVGNLENIAQRFGAFAVKAAHRQAQFVDGLNDRIDLLGQNQPGRCSIALTRMPVPILVGQAVR